MIRDPSDGSVKPPLSKHNEFNPQREYPGSYGATPDPSPVIDTTTSGLQTGSTKPEYQARLDESRKWLAKYHANKPTPETAIADGESE